MRKFSRLSLFAIVGLLSFASVGLSSCGSNEFSTVNVRLSASYLKMEIGDTKELTCFVSPKSAANSSGLKPIWISDNTSVALAENGYVIAVGPGKCNVHCVVYGSEQVCTVEVIDSQTVIDTPTLVLSPSSKTIKVNDSFQLQAIVFPEDTSITYTSTNDSIATVTVDGKVTGVSVGSTTITANGSNGLSDICTVTVEDAGGGGGEEEFEDLRFTGTYKVGAPVDVQPFMRELLNEFNRRTHSTITWELTLWEESDASGYMTKPADGPDIYPYASDQTLDLYSRGALKKLGKSESQLIREKMGEDAYNYAYLKGVNAPVGYPFVADNGYVMFYDKSLVSDPSEIDTLDKLFAKAQATGTEVNYNIANSFYAAGALMSFAGGKSLYTCNPKSDGRFTSTSEFATNPAGLKGAELLTKIYSYPSLNLGEETPGASRDVLATIADSSKVATFKSALGANYACAPLPFTDETRTTRCGCYLGYKFYGINPQRANTAERDKVATKVVQFLVSEYAQRERLAKFYNQPTLLSLQEEAAKEPHIAALQEQVKSNGVIPLTAVDPSLWDSLTSASEDIKNLGLMPTEQQYLYVLQQLDLKLTR
ncbi:MAG: extracellular solute-binding protein [Bacilli bacterium]|nr:extracellular solute-binding protein [Bacilli bacterium]